MGKSRGLQRKDITNKIDEFNSAHEDFAKILIISKNLAGQMSELIQEEQEEKKEALGDIYLSVIYSKIFYMGCLVVVSPIADKVNGGILIG